MKLYFSPGACSLSPHIVLRETGMKFDLEQVNNQEKKTKSGVDMAALADRNSFVPIADKLGFEIDKTPPPWRKRGLDAGFPMAEHEDFLAAMDAFDERIQKAAKNDADDFCESLSRTRQPLESDDRRHLDLCEWLRTRRRLGSRHGHLLEDTRVNWRVRRGYGALIAAYARPWPLVLNTRVWRIDHPGRRSAYRNIERRAVRDAGDHHRADQPAAERIPSVSTPSCPQKVNAATGLPLGVDDKVILALDDPRAWVPKDGNLSGATMRTKMETYHLRPFGQPCIEGFFGGSFARELEDAGDGAFAAQAIDEIAALLGSDYRRKLKPLAESHWASDPFAQGADPPRPARTCRCPRRAGRAR